MSKHTEVKGTEMLRACELHAGLFARCLALLRQVPYEREIGEKAIGYVHHRVLFKGTMLEHVAFVVMWADNKGGGAETLPAEMLSMSDEELDVLRAIFAEVTKKDPKPDAPVPADKEFNAVLERVLKDMKGRNTP